MLKSISFTSKYIFTKGPLLNSVSVLTKWCIVLVTRKKLHSQKIVLKLLAVLISKMTCSEFLEFFYIVDEIDYGKRYFLPSELVFEMLTHPAFINELLLDCALQYLILDLGNYQEFLASEASYPLKIAETLGNLFFQLPSEVPLKCHTTHSHMKYNLKFLISQSFPPDKTEYLNKFISVLSFVDRVYNASSNSVFLDHLTKSIFNSFLLLFIQPNILKWRYNTKAARTSIQYLTLILQIIPNKVFTKMILRFLFDDKSKGKRTIQRSESAFSITLEKRTLNFDNIREMKPTFELLHIAKRKLIDSEINFSRSSLISVELMQEYNNDKHNVKEIKEYIISQIASKQESSFCVMQLIYTLLEINLQEFAGILFTGKSSFIKEDIIPLGVLANQLKGFLRIKARTLQEEKAMKRQYMTYLASVANFRDEGYLKRIVEGQKTRKRKSSLSFPFMSPAQRNSNTTPSSFTKQNSETIIDLLFSSGGRYSGGKSSLRKDSEDRV